MASCGRSKANNRRSEYVLKVSVLRIGHRLVRDDRLTTHAALVSRAFGSDKIYMSEVDDSLKQTIEDVGRRWGGRSDFKVEIVGEWKEVIKAWKKEGGKVVHLTMYGIHIDNAISNLRQENTILAVIGAEKVPREMYDLADYNIAIGNQPHSEVAALSIFLDRMFRGKQFEKEFRSAKLKIVPTAKGKRVRELS
ncbi:MAG TPA: tRNA (cytidine(56)-2'-O)-methyltransferase [Candidatus Nitrosopolaris sp.]|nr:tRNA (cytidine(56)-2'-O)-methyltransferase [Candidatus Nitrosopolaris sp.]